MWAELSKIHGFGLMPVGRSPFSFYIPRTYVSCRFSDSAFSQLPLVALKGERKFAVLPLKHSFKSKPCLILLMNVPMHAKPTRPLAECERSMSKCFSDMSAVENPLIILGEICLFS